jgi:hypothetical protein
MLKTRARCATRSAERLVRRVTRVSVTFAAVAFAGTLLTSATTASAAARRIALVHAQPELQRSVDLALYPWDIKVVTVDDEPPDGVSPGAAAAAKAIAERNDADAIAWIVPAGAPAVPLLWFYDTTSGALQSRTLPALASDDPAELAAVALTLKTLVRSTPWEQRLPTVTEPLASTWETRLELEAMARIPTSGADAEPRLGLWASEWHGTSRLRWGAGLGASAGLGMRFDGAASHGTLEDFDLRADLRARILLGWHLELEPRVGASAHVERAEVTVAAPAASETLWRVNPSLDLGLFLDWQVTRSLAWSIGVEGLDSLRYQRWLAGSEVAFAPSPLWVQAGSSLAWSFR